MTYIKYIKNLKIEFKIIFLLFHFKHYAFIKIKIIMLHPSPPLVKQTVMEVFS